MEIAGAAALVSGGASGLGRATAKALAEAGAKVALLDIDGAAAETAAKELGGLGLACDVTKADAVEGAVAAARDKHGGRGSSSIAPGSAAPAASSTATASRCRSTSSTRWLRST